MNFPQKNKRQFIHTEEQITGGDGRDLLSFDIRFKFESDVPNRIRFEETTADSKISNRPHMPCAVIPQTTLTHCSTQNINLCAVCIVVEIYVYNSTLRVAVLLHIYNTHMTIGIAHVNDYPLIRFEIRFERKFPIRRSLGDGDDDDDDVM